MQKELDQTPYYSPGILAKNGKFQDTCRQKRIPSERAPQEQQNDAKFSVCEAHDEYWVVWGQAHFASRSVLVSWSR